MTTFPHHTSKPKISFVSHIVVNSRFSHAKAYNYFLKQHEPAIFPKILKHTGPKRTRNTSPAPAPSPRIGTTHDVKQLHLIKISTNVSRKHQTDSSSAAAPLERQVHRTAQRLKADQQNHEWSEVE